MPLQGDRETSSVWPTPPPQARTDFETPQPHPSLRPTKPDSTPPPPPPAASSHRKRARDEAEDDVQKEKRRRNNIAAAKCRQKKLDRIAELEEQLAEVKSERDALRLLLAQRDEEIRVRRELVQDK
jgi:beta-glucosidase